MAGCGGAASSSNTAPASYLHVGQNLANGGSVSLLQWGAPGSDGQIAGTLTFDGDGWNPPTYDKESIAVNSVPFTGQIHGRSIVLHLKGKLANTIIGTIANDMVKLSGISGSGLASNLTFRKATMAQYNKAVVQMRQAIRDKCASAAGCSS
jgi:hypothetical protein